MGRRQGTAATYAKRPASAPSAALPVQLASGATGSARVHLYFGGRGRPWAFRRQPPATRCDQDTKRCLRRLLPPNHSHLMPSPELAIAGPAAERYARRRLAAAQANRQTVRARTRPIRREVVLRPSWRAWRSLLSMNRKSILVFRQCSQASTFAKDAPARRRRSISTSIARTLSRVGSLTPARLVDRAPSARHNWHASLRAAQR